MVLAYILLLHFISDFLFDFKNTAYDRHHSPSAMTTHIMIVYAVFSIGLFPIYKEYSILFATMNAAIHAFIDIHIWKPYEFMLLTRTDDKAGDPLNDRWMYVTIGLDQMLHLITLIFVYWVLNVGSLTFIKGGF